MSLTTFAATTLHILPVTRKITYTPSRNTGGICYTARPRGDTISRSMNTSDALLDVAKRLKGSCKETAGRRMSRKFTPWVVDDNGFDVSDKTSLSVGFK